MRLATYNIKSIPDADNFVYEVKIKSGDSIAKIAKENNTQSKPSILVCIY